MMVRTRRWPGTLVEWYKCEGGDVNREREREREREWREEGREREREEEGGG